MEDTWLNNAMGCSPSTLGNWTCGLACTKVPLPAPRMVTLGKKWDTLQVVARRSSKQCHVVFRGSKNFWNTIEDAKFVPIALPGCSGCTVHRGFLEGWQEVRDEIKAALNQLGCSNSTVTLTGHSLGGAMGGLFGRLCLPPRSYASCASLCALK